MADQHNDPNEQAADADNDPDKEAAAASDSANDLKSRTLRFLSRIWETVKWILTCQPCIIVEILDEFTLFGIVNFIKSQNVSKIIVMTGAGVSTSAGIPDFRSPDIGLYANMDKYNLPHPQAMFDINYFKRNPEPFFTLAKSLLPIRLKPTPSHYFLMLLHRLDLLLRVYTQNIDSLEHVAGLPDDKVVEAHGSFHRGHCMRCHATYDFDWLKDNIHRTTVPRCVTCRNVVKPDVVLFGEKLSDSFFRSVDEDFSQCELLIIMGTSLVVQPFSKLISRVGENTPRLLINKGKAGIKSLFMEFFTGDGLEYDRRINRRDVFWRGSCDDGCMKLARLLGSEDDLKHLMKEGWKLLEDDHSGGAC